MRGKKLNRKIAGFLAVVLFFTPIFTYLPPGIFDSWGFGLMFVTSGQPGHPYLMGKAPGDKDPTWFFCMNKGASAHSNYDYSKVNMDIDYNRGTIEQKRMFWAYIGAFGSYDRDTSLTNRFDGQITPDIGREVAWNKGKTNGGSPWVESQANDGFMSLENIPEGCKSPEDILELISKYNSESKAMYINDLRSGPGQIDTTKLYQLTGLKDWETFKRYCVIEPATTGSGLVINTEGQNLSWSFPNAPAGQKPAEAVMKITYDPNIFRVLEVTGTLEYFQCNVPGSQQLYRAKGNVIEKGCEFFLTTKYSANAPTPTPGDVGEISLKVYQHNETFEANYKVELEKRDYETGNPLQGSTWQVLEQFDDSQLSNDESRGGIIEDNMREDPTTWQDWLVFDDDLVTDASGRVSHKDTRYYDFGHSYCNGHPIPPEPEIEESEGGDGEEGEEGSSEADEAAEAYERLMEEWRAAVDECEARAASSGGTFHHWSCEREDEPSEEEAFEESGCKEARDDAYQTFINLEYDYTFRETKPRDGYIIHDPGHPDDVPIEIITTAASESGKAKKWRSASNSDITVSGYIRNMAKGGSSDIEGFAGPIMRSFAANLDIPELEESNQLDESEFTLEENDTNIASPSTYTDSSEESGDLILKETYDLPLGERIINKLLKFIGLPAAFAEEKEITVKLTAKDDEELIIDEDFDEEFEAEEEEDQFDEFSDDDDATPSQAKKSFMSLSLGSSLKSRSSMSDSVATASEASIPKEERRQLRQISLLAEDTEEEPVMTTMLGRSALSRASSKGYDDGEEDSQPEVSKGPSNNTAHTFKVYDHRVPGQLHFNKRDMELKAGESANYDSYGESQGDATLEGALYGLFAADPIYGPDTQRDDNGNVTSGIGVVFDANDLVSVAAVDKNGEGSFLAITERPHSIYNYKAGKIEYTGKSYPENLYVKNGYEKAQPQEEKGRIYKDNKTMNGDSWIGRPLILGNYYIKELTRSEGYELSITGKDMEVTNANDSTRSSYGETADAKTAPVGSAWISKQLYNAVTFPEGNEAYGNKENLLLLETKSKDATNGYNVVLDGIPEGADVYLNNVTLKPVVIQQVDGGKYVDAKEAPFYLTAESDSVYKRDINGYMIEKSGVTASVKIPYEAAGTEAEKLPTEGTATASDPAKFTSTFTNSDSNIKYVKAELEQMMRNSLHMETPKDGDYSTVDAPVYDEKRTVNGKTVYGKPEMVLEIDNVTTNKSVIETILNYYINEKVFTYGGLQKIEYSGGKAIVTIVVGMSPQRTLLYQTNSSGDIVAGYLTKLNTTYGRYVIRKYTGTELNAAEVGNTGKYIINVMPDYEVGDDGIPTDKTMYPSDSERYLRYATGETLYDYWYLNGGTYVGHAPVTRKVWEPNYKEVIVNEENVSAYKITKVGSLEEVVDRVGSTYYYYDNVAKQYIIHVGSKDMDLTGVKSGNFTIALNNGKTVVSGDDIRKIGSNNVWGYTAGGSISNAEYVIRITGAGAGVSTSSEFDTNKTFIKNQHLICNGYHDLLEDGNTRETPTPVLERIIGQQIKVTKTIDEKSYNNKNSYDEVHDDWFTRTFGGFFGKNTAAKKMDNFRYKVYLKSNLERLFRDNDGNIVWQDKAGAEINALEKNKQFPALVNKIYTKVQRVTTPLYKNSDDAIVNNEALYNYNASGFINDIQNSGYTSVLETVGRLVDDGAGTRTVNVYNYDKFFDAITVANNDKWDDASPTYTSWQPIGNAVNRTGNSIENAKASDKVRQFAIDWYLDDEIKKLVKAVPNNNAEREDKDGKVPYSDEMYDEALHNAIIKAENYLKPFFAYDLDEIYAISWDSADAGGSDKDLTTLSADTQFGDVDNSGDGYYFATSKYLPYGTYVIAEQQPKYDKLGDFKNKHYQIDKPREVVLPSVYASYDGSQRSPEVLNSYYNYDANITQAEMERKFKIRFNEEFINDAGHLITARNADGDFQVYKYGLDIDNVRNGVTGSGAGDYFALTQDVFKPYKNYYNAQDDRTNGNIPYYLTEGLSGRDKVSKYYRYSSVSENKGAVNAVPFPGGVITEDNPAGIQYKDNVITMQGMQTAYHGKYAPMLVPWTIVASENAAAEVEDSKLQSGGESSYKGFDYIKFKNRFFTTKLRIEKLDSETHENILHDGALFNIYAAKRNDAKDGDGSVMFYETDTTVTGTKEFLEAMRATNIQPNKTNTNLVDPLTGKEYGPESLYTGVISAGTPICDESEKIILGDSYGDRTVAFKTYSTVLDGLMKDEKNNSSLVYQNQTVGYVETPQPLGAGAYVLCEVKPPSGYTRTNPVAIEVYSDKVTYYKEANKDKRVLAAMYEYPSDNQTTNGNKPQDLINVARINVENAPIKLSVEKLKESSVDSANTTADKTVTYKVSGRIDGNLAKIGNNPDYEYAYNDAGDYLGYAWKKGTLEYLLERKKAGEQVEIVYEGNVFAGYGLITRKLDTADDSNKYVVGATMTLFDALEMFPSGDTQDHAFDGLVIERNSNNDVKRMYVKQGYTGTKVEFVKEKDENGNEYKIPYQTGIDKNGIPINTEGNIWTAETIERSDTDILYYDLDSLDILKKESVDGTMITYGYNKYHDKVSIKQIESDKKNHPKSDTEYSIFAFKGGIPYLEFVGGDFAEISYSAINKTITVGEKTKVYHLDRDGNRDALVDPYTGMAYVTEIAESGQERFLVWAVNIHKDEFDNVIARDKIKTSRIATLGENKDGYHEEMTVDVTNNSGNPISNENKPSYSHFESGYITGSWKSNSGEKSHKETTLKTNEAGQNMNDEVLVNDNNGSFNKELNPTFDEHGLVNYYQRSGETYQKGTPLYDRNGDFVRYQDSDNLEKYNNAAYRINEDEELYDGVTTKENQTQKNLYHRWGEGYILENTWVTSDKTPNDPFDTAVTDGQPDILKRVPVGHYIMEELKVPVGYLKGMPTGLSVNETAAMQHTKMVDKTTKIEISKIDGTSKRTYNVVNMKTGLVEGTAVEDKDSFGYGQVSDAVIALYKAKKVFTSDFIKYPDGYYLVRASESDGPVTYYSTENMASHIKEITAKWTTGAAPIYSEGIPEGYYLLEELSAPGGFAISDPVEVYVSNTSEVQTVIMEDDHTKVEIAKHEITNDGKKILSGAGFTLYKGQADGSYNPADVVDSWLSDDATDFTDSINLKDYPNIVNGKNEMTGFRINFEEMYKQYGTDGRSFIWSVERKAVRSSADDNVWLLEDHKLVRVVNNVITFPAGMTQEDRDGFYASYLANTKNGNTIKWAIDKSAQYVSHTQIDSSVAGGVSTKFPTTATMIFKVDDGREVRITAYQKSINAAGPTYTFEYKFDYKKLSGINKYACSYLTADGHQRFDYLPIGSVYVLVETTVPEGYAKAEDTVITVSDMDDVQYYSIINETKALRISKVAEDRSGELVGAKLALYKAANDGSFVHSEEYLITSWITGEDGTYTVEDFVNGLIPDGYKRGDLKPHTIRGLEDGTYYVLELNAPDYFTAIEPVNIEYKGQDEIEIVRVTDKIVKGQLEIIKTDMNDAPLSGVTFQITAYRNGTGDVVLDKAVNDTNGKVLVKDLPVGELSSQGQVEPYTYKVREITPPDGFAASSLIKTFQFKPNKNGVSYQYDEFASEVMTVQNDKTRIYIEKRNFSDLTDEGIDGAFVDGAVLAVYELLGRDGEDNFIYDETKPIEKWTSSTSEPRHMIEGLIAGRTYLLKELKAPAGYNLMKPVAFTISSNGRGIYGITNKLNTITVNYIQPTSQYLDTDNLDIDSIESVTLTGRYVSKIEMVITDSDGSEAVKWVSNGKPHTLLKTDGVQDGKVYTFTEYTCYSDGSRVITNKTTKRVVFNEKEEFTINTRGASYTNLAVYWTDGTEITNFNPNEFVADKTIKNNVNPENPKVTVKNRNGENGDALNPKQVVINTITYVNTANIKSDITITAKVDNNVTILSADNGGEVNGDTITWVIEDVAPSTSGYITFDSEISNKTAKSISIDTKIAYNGKEISTKKMAPVMQPNKLTVYNELTGSGKDLYSDETSSFRIRLYSETGSELLGTYSYTGSRDGVLRSGDIIELAGNEFITIDPGYIYKNIRYKVERIDDGSQKRFTERNTEGIAAETTGAFVTFTRNVRDTSEREIFSKGESYLLVERTAFSNGDIIESNKLQFTLNEQASISGVAGYDKETHVMLSKTDITTGNEIPGAYIVLKDKDGNVIEEWVSTDKPHEIIGVLIPGEKYTMIEEAAPDGYAFAEEITFIVNEDGSVDKVVMEDKKTHVMLSKTDIVTGKELPGAHIVIKDKNSNIVDEWISTDKPHEIVGKLIAGETYWMIEVGPADGYAYAADIEFTVSLDGTIDKVVMEDKPTHVVLSKTDITTGKELPGAQIAIKDKDGNIVEEWTSTDTPHEIVGKLIAGETYMMVEVHAADGYAYAADIKFTVSLDGAIDKVVMEDKPTHVVLRKTDIITGEELPGAHIVIKDSNGNIVDEWTSTDKAHEIIGKLIAGEEYIMYEESSPEGYGYATEIKFTVNMDGSINKVVMEDKPTEVSISKVDITTEKELPGAALIIKDKNDNVVEEWLSTDKPHIIVGKLIAGEEYSLIEVMAPDGYLIAESIKFTVNRDGSIASVVMKDKRKPGDKIPPPVPKYPVVVTKKNVAGDLVPGAEYGLFTEDGERVSSGFTKKDGIVTLYAKAGNYYIQEISAPSGYALSPVKYPVTVTSTGEIVGETEVVDDFAVVAISKLDVATLEALENAEFTLFELDGTPVATVLSGPEGYAEFREVLYGEYYIMETNAPEGYVLSPEKRYVSVTKFYTNAASIIWYNNPDTWIGRPRTGDDSPIIPVAVLLIISASGLALISYRKRKREEEE